MSVYISVDVETTGPIPGPYSMLSLGAVAFKDGVEVGQFYVKLKQLPYSSWEPSTSEWWSRFPEAFAEATSNAIDAKGAMQSFVDWCRQMAGGGGWVVLCADPAAFDGMFVNWYAVTFVGTYDKLPWKHRVLDIRTYCHALLGKPFHESHRSTFGEVTGFEPSVQHDHTAVNDARGQGEYLMAMLAKRAK